MLKYNLATWKEVVAAVLGGESSDLVAKRLTISSWQMIHKMMNGKQLQELNGRRKFFDENLAEEWPEFVSGDTGTGYAVYSVDADAKAT